VIARTGMNLHVKVDFEKAAASDSIRDAVDYRALTRRLTAAGESSRFQLIETLAAHLVRVILDDFPSVQEVRVEAEKPGALGTACSVRAVAAAQPRLTRQSRSVSVSMFTVSGWPAERGRQGRRCESAATPSL